MRGIEKDDISDSAVSVLMLFLNDPSQVCQCYRSAMLNRWSTLLTLGKDLQYKNPLYQIGQQAEGVVL